MFELQGGLRTSKLFMQDEWQPGLFYHIIGKAIPGETLFRDERDMWWFAKHVLRFKLWHFFEILVYCMCGNHFHLVIRTRHTHAIRACLRTKPAHARSPSDERMLGGEITYRAYVHAALAGAFSGYARHYNSTYDRSEQLFVLPTLHGLTTKGAPGALFSRRLCGYVGFNFAKHHIAPASALYYGSSLTNPLFKIVDHEALLDLFGGAAAYKAFHDNYIKRYGPGFYAFDEDDFYAALRPRLLDEVTGAWREGDWLSELLQGTVSPT